MRHFLGQCILVFGLAAGAGQMATAQPSLGYVFPAGGQRGTSFEVEVAGQKFAGLNQVWVSGKGVHAEIFEVEKLINQREFNTLREEQRTLERKRAAWMRRGNPVRELFKPKRPGSDAARSSASGKEQWTEQDAKRLAEIRKLLANRLREQAYPALGHLARVKITIAADAEPGARELRVGAPSGWSNPLVFRVSDLPEVREKEARWIIAPRTAEPTLAGKPRLAESEEAVLPVEPPVVVNGQILPGDVDRYRFFAKAGQQIVVAVQARALIPYLADAVPGWFQAVVGLYDPDGREVAYADDFRFDPDPVLFFKIPRTAEYEVRIRDSIYRGRDDFVYRMVIGELPFVTGIFPLGGPVGKPVKIALQGWNLPVRSVTARFDKPGMHVLEIPELPRLTGRLPFVADTLPESMEQEPNDTPNAAQPLTLPRIVNGRIGRPGDQDVFRFDGQAGQEIVVEVMARRLHSPLDSWVELLDAQGRRLAFNDDHVDPGAGLITHHADSWLKTKLPASGTYYVRLRDGQGQGGEPFAYRLRLSEPQPDFALRVVPSVVNAQAGQTVPITVYALRQDGFEGDIRLRLSGAPTGVVLSGGWVPSGQDKVQVTLTVASTPRSEPIALTLQGEAEIGGRTVVRPATPADDLMQAFIYHHLVPAQQWWLSVTGRRRFGPPVRLASAEPVRLPAGGTTQVEVTGPVGAARGPLKLELMDGPEGIALKRVTPGQRGVTIELAADPKKVEPGQKGNLILEAYMMRQATSTKDGKRVPARRVPLGVLPAIPFEVVSK